MARSEAAENFEWPPPGKALTSQVFEFRNQGVEPAHHPYESGASGDVAARPEEDSKPNPPDPPEQEQVDIALRRLIQQRAAAAKAPAQSMRGSGSSSRLSSRFVPAALIAVSLAAILEGAYIVYTLRQSPAAQLNPVETASPAADSAAAPALEPAAVDIPRITASSSPLGTAGVSYTKSAPARGRLVVRSDPSGAQVFIDGRSYGLTPLTLGTVMPGEHRILLKRNGTEVRQSVRVEAGHTLSIVAPMASNTSTSGWIAIASPVELDVFEGGALLGTSRSRQIMLNAGPHSLELVNEDLGIRQTHRVRVEAGKVEHIGVTLPETTINLNAVPWAEVWIDGKSVGQTPIGNLPIVIGTHEVVFRHPELGEKSVSTTVKAGVPVRLSADLRQ